MQEAGMSICSIEDALQALGADDFRAFSTIDGLGIPTTLHHGYPFGVWFRGQADSVWDLQPALFRNTHPGYEETSLFNLFQLKLPGYHNSCRGIFDWLCLMQHHRFPTRLLDWTESILVALFFAVQESTDKHADGRLFVLNSRWLNQRSTRFESEDRAGLCTPTSLDTAARAQLVVARNVGRWQELMENLPGTETRGKSWKVKSNIFNQKLDDLLEWLALPIAVFPSRHDTRMALQSSVFTMHGGKRYAPGYRMPDDLPPSVGLDELSARGGRTFIRSYRIPSQSKRPLRTQLAVLGVHHAALFPELDEQAGQMAEQWQFEDSEHAGH